MKSFGVFVCLRPWASALWPSNFHGLVTCLAGVKINKLHNGNDSSTGHLCVPCPRSKYGNVETFCVSMGNKCCLSSLHISAFTSVPPSASLLTTVLLDHTTFSVVNMWPSVYFSIILSSVVCDCNVFCPSQTFDFPLPLHTFNSQHEWLNKWMNGWILIDFGVSVACLGSWRVWICLCGLLPAIVMSCLALPGDRKEIDSPARRSTG